MLLSARHALHQALASIETQNRRGRVLVKKCIFERKNKLYATLKNSLDTAKEEGQEEGMEVKAIDIAKSLLKNGISIEIISKSTGLSVEEIKKKENKRG